ncbi:hypothetical protein [Celeribacter sp.]|uniref:hypothetical protein n=1 Tax=Celeribacter sp. TaxID=1890673 RepID=UPI003A8D6668
MIVDLLLGLVALLGLVVGAMKLGERKERRRQMDAAEKAQERRRAAQEEAEGMTDAELARAITRRP